MESVFLYNDWHWFSFIIPKIYLEHQQNDFMVNKNAWCQAGKSAHIYKTIVALTGT